ncbi:MAG TPA: tetratricopeptide repeat protein [Phycisphaerales bacterium]|nr:tetratricopeptide repeat protein [Phycisphaerales bacterium]
MNGRFSRLEVEARETALEPPQQALDPAQLGNTVRTSSTDMQLADDAYRHGRFELALQMYTKALGKNQSLVAAWVGQVQMLVELGEYPEARLWADKALELFRNNGDLLAAKARASARQRDHSAAMACIDAAVQSSGSSPLRWVVRGEVLLPQNAARARDCFEKALTEPNADWFDRVIVARTYLFHKRGVLAMDMARAAVGLRADHGYCWYVLGGAQQLVGWADQAATSYQRALDLCPSLTQARDALRALRSRSLTQRLTGRIGGLFKR